MTTKPHATCHMRFLFLFLEILNVEMATIFIALSCQSQNQSCTNKCARRFFLFQTFLRATISIFLLLDPPVEEELEWLNKDVFPGVETFLDYLPTSVENIPKQQSPISVLENSSHSSSSNNSNSSTTTIMSCCENFRVPSRARSKRRRRRHKDFSDIPGQPWWWWSSQGNTNANDSSPTNSKQTITSSTIGRKCQHCQAEKTPQWRAGPLGPKTLCNACGVRYKSGRLVAEYRPASSPTFSSKVHSNSHRKIMEMRKLKQRDMVVRPCG